MWIEQGLDLHIHGVERYNLVEIADGEPIRRISHEPKPFVSMVVADVLELSFLP